MFRKTEFLASFSVLVMNSAVSVALAQDLNTLLMNSTFEITGKSAEAEGKMTFGTIFVLGKPLKAGSTKGSPVLITAAHVLDGIAGDTAMLMLRKRDTSGRFIPFFFTLSIRNQGKNFYVKNPHADVAAMYLNVPNETEMTLLPLAPLAHDATLQRLEVHPGDELLCLGFPLGIDIKGFPVIRSGLLASYPITPARTVKQFYYNFHAFPGNSGGPVYFTFPNRTFGGGTVIGIQQGIIGLVSAKLRSPLPEYKDAQLDITIVVPSAYIQDTIAMLP